MKPNDPLDDFQPPEGPPRHPVRFWWIVLSIVLLALLILLLLIRVNTPEAGSVLGYQPTPGFTGGTAERGRRGPSGWPDRSAAHAPRSA
jgi:hypothetical protein